MWIRRTVLGTPKGDPDVQLLRGTPKKIVVVKVVVTDSAGKRKTTLRGYRTCAKKTAGANTLVT